MAVLGQAKVGKMRLGAHRLNFYQPSCYATLGGVRCETQMLDVSLRITKRTNSASAVQGTTHSAVFRMKTGSVTPLEGKDVKLYCGSTAPQSLLFGGTIQQLTQVYEGEKQSLIFFDVTAVGYGWLFNRRVILSKSYRQVSATTIVKDLVSTYASGFTTTHVEAVLPLVSIAFTNTYLADALNEIARRVGARWFLDDTKDLWFFVTDSRMKPETIAGKSTTNPLSNIFKLLRTKDLSQVRTKVYATGGASNSVLGSVASGSVFIPVDSAYPYALPLSLAQGQAQLQLPGGVSPTTALNITYTGTHRSSLIAAPPTSATGVTVGASGAGGGLVSSATYYWGFTLVTANGETPISGTVSRTLGGAETACNLDFTNATWYAALNSALYVTERTVKQINVYRSVANGGSGDLRFNFSVFFGENDTHVASPNSWPQSFTDLTSDSDLTGPPPLNNGATQGAVSTTSANGANPGNTTITGLKNITIFDPNGGYALVGNTPIQYTGWTITGASGTLVGTLTLSAALTGSLKVGGTVSAVPALTGVPASSTGSVTSLVPLTTRIVPYFQVEDAAAQTALAALVGGDGVHEHVISDASLTTVDAVATEAQGSLTLNKAAEQSIELESRDYKFQPGIDAVINIGSPTNIAGTFRISDLTITQIALKVTGPPYVYPLINARGSTMRWTLDDFLWRLKLLADQAV